MKTKTLWLIWLYLFALVCIFGFIPNPTGFIRIFLIVVGSCFFIPGGFLLARGDKTTVRLIVIFSAASLVLTTVCIILNYASILMPMVWGTVFHILLGILSTPMFCTQIWLISLFGWACLLMAGIEKLRKMK